MLFAKFVELLYACLVCLMCRCAQTFFKIVLNIQFWDVLALFPGLPTNQLYSMQNTASDQKLDGGKACMGTRLGCPVWLLDQGDMIEHQPMYCQYQGCALLCMKRSSVPGRKVGSEACASVRYPYNSWCLEQILQLLRMFFPCQYLPEIAHDSRIGSISFTVLHWLVRASCESHGC